MPGSPASRSPQRQHQSRQPSIVIVDDTPTLLTLVSRLLGRNGYRCFCCMDSRLALGFIQGIQPDLVILDLMMPTVSGDELLEAIRRTPALSSVPVLLVSGKSQFLSAYQQKPELQPLATLAKPFTTQVLMAAVEELLTPPNTRSVGEG